MILVDQEFEWMELRGFITQFFLNIKSKFVLILTPYTTSILSAWMIGMSRTSAEMLKE